MGLKLSTDLDQIVVVSLTCTREADYVSDHDNDDPVVIVDRTC